MHHYLNAESAWALEKNKMVQFEALWRRVGCEHEGLGRCDVVAVCVMSFCRCLVFVFFCNYFFILQRKKWTHSFKMVYLYCFVGVTPLEKKKAQYIQNVYLKEEKKLKCNLTLRLEYYCKLVKMMLMPFLL